MTAPGLFLVLKPNLTGDRGRIFESFTQVSAGVRRGGAGLGLAVVRDLVDRHGGELWLNSKVGKGSTFYFSLPVASTREDGAPGRAGGLPCREADAGATAQAQESDASSRRAATREPPMPEVF